MSEQILEYYWDTCVFIAYLNDDRVAYGSLIDDIGQFLAEAQRGECRIYCSSITIAEVTRDKLVSERYRSFPEFLQAYQSAVVTVTPDNNVRELYTSQTRDLEQGFLPPIVVGGLG